MTKFFLDQFGKLMVALLYGSALFWQDNRLEEWDDVFLPVYALVFLLQIHKWNDCLAMPNVWRALSSPQDSDDHRLLEFHIEQDIEKGPCVPII